MRKAKNNAKGRRQAAGQRQANRRAAQRPQRAAPARAPRQRRAALQAAPGARTLGTETPFDTLKYRLTNEEAAQTNYMFELSDPDAEPSGVPLIFGTFELKTNKYRWEVEGESTSNGAGGFAFVMINMDGWLQNGNNDGAPAQQYLTWDTTGGNAVLYSQSTYVGSSTPTALAALPTGCGGLKPPKLDTGFDADTRYRQVSAHLDVWSDTSYNTAQGNVTIAVTQTSETLNEGALNAVTEGQINGYPQDYVAHKTRPLSGWQSGERLSAFVVPTDEECFAMDLMPATAAVTTTVGFASMAAVATGLAAGQTFRWRYVATYETTAPISYMTNRDDAATTHIGMDSMYPIMSALRPGKTWSGKKGDGNKIAAAAASQVLGARSPALANEAKSDNSKLIDAAKNGASWLLGKVPYVGGALKTGFDWIFG